MPITPGLWSVSVVVAANHLKLIGVNAAFGLCELRKLHVDQLARLAHHEL
jgi:hypothetical protein